MSGEGDADAFECLWYFWEFGLDGRFHLITSLGTFEQTACRKIHEGVGGDRLLVQLTKHEIVRRVGEVELTMRNMKNR